VWPEHKDDGSFLGVSRRILHGFRVEGQVEVHLCSEKTGRMAQAGRRTSVGHRAGKKSEALVRDGAAGKAQLTKMRLGEQVASRR
jgi:hypothetical protein